MASLLAILLLLIQLWAALLVTYLLLLTIAAFSTGRGATAPSANPQKRFAILIPAHNEELLLPELLASLSTQDYPAALRQIHVVADNCTDRTAEAAQAGGAQAHVRHDLDHPGKGPALEWLFKRVCPEGAPFDAVLILDADSVVLPNFLAVMAGRLERGERVIQAYYAVRDATQSWNSGLRQAALAVLHFLRPQGRMALGGSAGLKGNGMVFAIDILRNYGWSASITEDIELHMNLILQGERVTFAPDAVVLGEMPHDLANSKSQHLRWERGKQEMNQEYVPELLAGALQAAAKGQWRQSYLLFDAVMEFWIPAFSILFGLSGLLALGSLLYAGMFLRGWLEPTDALNRLVWTNLALSAFIVIGQVIYLLAGLRAVHASKEIYRSLLFAPVYMIWKNLQVLQALLHRGPLEWVRTNRNEG